MLDETLQELETWRRDLRTKVHELITNQHADDPLPMLQVATALSYLESSIHAIRGVQNALDECRDIVEQIDADREVTA